MKRLAHVQFGNPSEVIQLEEREIRPPLPDEVQVRWKFSPILPADMAIIRGTYRVRHTLPTTCGIDGCGEVVALGENVKHLQLGQRMIVVPRNTFPYQEGTWQEVNNYDPKELLPVPLLFKIADETLAQFHSTFLSTWVMLMEDGKAVAGDWVIVTAAGSTLGRSAIQLSKIFGFKVIAVVRRGEQRQAMLDMGAAEVICTDSEDLVQRVKVITKLKGARLAIDSVGGELTGQCVKGLCNYGKLIVCGILGQERVAPIDCKALVFGQVQVSGFWLGMWWVGTEEKERLSVCNKVFHQLATGQLKGQVQNKYNLTDFKKAFTEVESPGVRGRILFTP